MRVQTLGRVPNFTESPAFTSAVLSEWRRVACGAGIFPDLVKGRMKLREILCHRNQYPSPLSRCLTQKAPGIFCV